MSGTIVVYLQEVKKMNRLNDCSVLLLSFLLVLAIGGTGLGANVQTPSRKVQTPSLTMDLSSSYGFGPTEAKKLVIDYSDNRIRYAMENSTTVNDFYLYLLSPNTSVEVQKSCIAVGLSHPKTNEPITRFEPHITIADKKNNSLELIGTMQLAGKKYWYCVTEKKWLVSPKPRTHVVYIDLGELKRLRFEVEVTKSGEVKKPE